MNQVGWQFELYGDLENLNTAEYVYYFLINQGEDLWLKYKKLYGAEVSRKKRFFLTGLYDGFYKKFLVSVKQCLISLQSRKSKMISWKSSLLNINPTIRRRTVRQSVDPKIYNDGVSEGKRVKH